MRNERFFFLFRACEAMKQTLHPPNQSIFRQTDSDRPRQTDEFNLLSLSRDILALYLSSLPYDLSRSISLSASVKHRRENVAQSKRGWGTESWTCNFEPDAYNFAFISKGALVARQVRRGSPIALQREKRRGDRRLEEKAWTTIGTGEARVKGESK